MIPVPPWVCPRCKLVNWPHQGKTARQSCFKCGLPNPNLYEDDPATGHMATVEDNY